MFPIIHYEHHYSNYFLVLFSPSFIELSTIVSLISIMNFFITESFYLLRVYFPIISAMAIPGVGQTSSAVRPTVHKLSAYQASHEGIANTLWLC